ncbi:SWIM zinc finger family protein [Jidongwangia harbinensis]|uniref:SWIM zinc finger family protein n=1 Tax=Jidongwangia harbinensis TaxID=2878561 RepID=UPI001CD9516B|nr:hypothetical protein [Jidongwangia harbinensis]MCA2216395.1 hypothetical protein [Jidongwangia harbinensis]
MTDPFRTPPSGAVVPAGAPRRSGATPFSAPFVAMFEALRMAPTFARGRRDARSGHVRHLTVSGSLAVALVRGPDEPAAHRSRIAVRALGAAEWSRVEDTLASQARYVADLLAGRMPADIDAVFAEAGLSLLPLSIGEIAMDCSCERWPMPCVHLAATCYALAAAFDTDPFEAFAWRGRPRDELLERLRRLRGAAAVEAAAPPAATATDPAELGDCADFWSGGTPSGTSPPVTPGRPDALLDQLDPPPLAVHGRPVTDLLRPAYQALPPD